MEFNPCCAFGDTRWSLEYLSNKSFEIEECMASCQVKEQLRITNFVKYKKPDIALTANIFESGPMPTPWKFLDSLPVIPSC